MNGRMVSTWVRRWWPVPAVLALSLVVQEVVLESRYDVAGHAAGHLSNATAPFFAAAMVVILLWATPAARRQPDALLACGAWLVATVCILIGNVRVVDDLVAAGLGHAPTEGLPDVADHGLANAAPWWAEVAVVAMAAVFWARGHVSRRVAIAAVVVTVLLPPWLNPGVGVVILVVARCLARREAIAPADAAPSHTTAAPPTD